MRKLSKKTRVIVAGAAIAGLVSAGGAYAYWTTTGVGAGTAGTAGSMIPLVITGNPAAGIHPSGSVSVVGNVNNPNASQSYVGTVSAAITTSPASCLATDFHFTPVTVNAVIAGTGNQAFTGSLTMDDTALNQDACKLATITLTYSIS